ncbi:Retrovirus-related Pol poly from transposon 412 [Paramuricea clavata]|uniref:Retrovirus-related Pol poly from transposon 412 n=1 Tax=Paramuricea clavata TaxID=317549 RepID=A0A7D9IUQ4_PARCT|nr:Retrovirus-related Pol poly from transposon 412 [Paramuricea clavata]
MANQIHGTGSPSPAGEWTFCLLSQVIDRYKRQPIITAILRSIFSQLKMSNYDDMFWAACCLAYFGFLRSSKFTVPNGDNFSQALHLSVSDITADQRVASSRTQVNIKVSKTDPFRQGCVITLGRGTSPLYPVEALFNYLDVRGGASGPLFVPLKRCSIK